MSDEYDIVVVGGGGSGLAAAVSAAENGARVLLVEKQSQLGGTTGLAVGSFTACQTRLQRQAGIKDSLNQHVIDASRFADPNIESKNNTELRKFFLSHAAETLHWLMEMGLTFQGPNPEPPNRVNRMHNVVPGAKAYIATLQSRFKRLHGDILVNAPVVRLRIEANSVTGVVCRIDGKETEFRAQKAVILAAGDYANCSATIARFKGDQFSQIEGINRHADGDGHRLVESVGGQLVNMDVTYGPELRFVPPPRPTFQQLLPTSGWKARVLGWLLPFAPRCLVNAMIRRLLVTWQHPEDALFKDGAILINQSGRRFCDETSWPDREIAVAAQPEKQCYLVLNRSLSDRYSRWPHFISTAPKIAYAYVDDYLKLRPDIALRGSLEEIANAKRIDIDALRKTVEEHCNDPNDATELVASSSEQWVVLGPAKAYFTTTEGGAAINQQFQVLDVHQQPIPGLYAVGQTGLGGQILWGHGLHIAWAMTSGRLVGKQLGSS